MNRRLTLALFALCFIFASVFSVAGQDGSYLDTIYRAGDSGTSAVSDEGVPQYIENTDQPPEVVDVPDPVGDPAQQKAIEKLQNIINSLMRIIAGKICGTRIVHHR